MDKRSMTVRISTVFGEKTFDMPADQALKLICFAEELSTLAAQGCEEIVDEDAVIDGTGATNGGVFIDDSGGIHYPKPVPKTRNETLFGDRSTWAVPRNVDDIQSDGTAEMEGGEAPNGGKRYSGLLLIKCEHCGKVKDYFTRYDIRYHQCECGHRTTLKDLRPAHAHCKCDTHKTYLTNITTEKISHNCFSCGAPIDMRLNGKGTAYVTEGRDRG